MKSGDALGEFSLIQTTFRNVELKVALRVLHSFVSNVNERRPHRGSGRRAVKEVQPSTRRSNTERKISIQELFVIMAQKR